MEQLPRVLASNQKKINIYVPEASIAETNTAVINNAFKG